MTVHLLQKQLVYTFTANAFYCLDDTLVIYGCISDRAHPEQTSRQIFSQLSWFQVNPPPLQYVILDGSDITREMNNLCLSHYVTIVLILFLECNVSPGLVPSCRKTFLIDFHFFWDSCYMLLFKSVACGLHLWCTVRMSKLSCPVSFMVYSICAQAKSTPLINQPPAQRRKNNTIDSEEEIASCSSSPFKDPTKAYEYTFLWCQGEFLSVRKTWDR